MGSFSIWHWLIVLLIVVMVFGTKKLKNLGSDLGGAVKGFKDGVKDGGTDAAAPGVATPGVATPGSVPAPGQVVNQTAADKGTIDVEAKQKL